MKLSHIKYMPTGQIAELRCKLCDRVIGETKPVDYGGMTHMVFLRTRSYAEIKILCSDGSHHVTNGCEECLTKPLTPETLTRMIKQDMPKGAKKRKGVKVVALDLEQKGIV